MEILDFGSLLLFIDFIKTRDPSFVSPAKNILQPIRSLRNACAHNNCLLCDMHQSPTTSAPPSITRYVAAIPGIGKETRQKKLACRPLFEITCLLFAYESLVSTKVFKYQMQQFKDFSDTRLIQHIDYFKMNNLITTSFEYLQKLVDNSAAKSL